MYRTLVNCLSHQSIIYEQILYVLNAMLKIETVAVWYLAK